MESHEQDLLDEVQDYEKVRAIQDDYTQVDLDPPTRALLDFAVKLTLQIHDMERDDVENLRYHGFSDESILDAVHLTSYFNFVNRVLDALGAEPEPGMRFPSPDSTSETVETNASPSPVHYTKGTNDGGSPGCM
jgi:uncharacterized peroxidase-related enzyme